MTDTGIDHTPLDPEYWLSSFLGDPNSCSGAPETPHDFTALQMPFIGGTSFHSTMHSGTEQPSTAHGDFPDGRGASLGFDTDMRPVTNTNRSFHFDNVDQELPHPQPHDRRPAILDCEIIAWGQLDRGSQQRLEAWYEVNKIEIGSWADREIRKGILNAVQPDGAGRVAVDQSKIQIVSESNIIDCRRCPTALKEEEG